MDRELLLHDRPFKALAVPEVIDLAGLRLRNADRAAVQLGNAVAAAGVDWTIGGAPSISMRVADADHLLLRGVGGYRPVLDLDQDGRLDGGMSLEVAGERHVLTGIDKDPGVGEALRLVHWIPWTMDEASSYRTAPWGVMSRSQFIASMVRESSPEIASTIYGVTMPAESTSSKRGEDSRARADRDAKRAPGFAPGVQLRIQGKIANSSQLRILAVALSRSDRRKSPERAVLADLATLIVESKAQDLSYGHADSTGPYQVRVKTAKGLGISPRNMEQCTDAFHTKGFWGKGSADELARRHPTMSPAAIAQTVQGSGHATRYQTKDGIDIAGEAQAILRAWGGLEGTDTSGSDTAQFARGERGKPEGSWVASGRLADVVQARRFVAQNRFFYGPDEWLMRGRPIVTLSESHPSVEKIGWNADARALVRRMTIEVRADAVTLLQMAARMVVVEDEGEIAAGMGDGRWLVTALSMQALGEQRGTIELAQPQSLLKEPTKTSSASGASVSMSSKKAASDAAGRAFDDPRVIKMRRRIDQITAQRSGYAWGGGHASFSGPYDCSGLQSAVLHAGGLLAQPMDTSRLLEWGKAGEGKVFTVWVKQTSRPDTSHTYSTWKSRDGGLRVCESASGGGTAGWRPGRQHPRPGFVPRHWEGL